MQTSKWKCMLGRNFEGHIVIPEFFSSKNILQKFVYFCVKFYTMNNVLAMLFVSENDFYVAIIVRRKSN